MKFRFEVVPPRLTHPIGHEHRLFLIGSCFTENIGEKLTAHKFRVLQNPHGILFNPVSVAEALTDYVAGNRYAEEDLFFLNEGWHSWKHHSRYSALQPGDALKKINGSIEEAQVFLKQTDYLMITLGSAWTYQLTEKAQGGRAGAVVANNHKAPADWFRKKLMTQEEIVQVLDNMLHRLFFFNPNIRILFTISPVRHLREGAVENNRSKAALISAVHHLVDKFDRLYYFPAYELVIDDLRDYRFFAEDLVHPNYFATEYVWEKFTVSCLLDPARSLMEEIAAINRAVKHKPFNPDSEAHRKFLDTYRGKMEELRSKHPYLDWSKEIDFFRTA